MPARVAFPPLWTKIGEPLSPPAEKMELLAWQSIVMPVSTVMEMLLTVMTLKALTSVQVFVTDPKVPPVVRPTLYSTAPDDTLPNVNPFTGRRGVTGLTLRRPGAPQAQTRGLAIS